MADSFEMVFAYGSNLCVEQMMSRCPSTVVVGAAALPRVRLAFAGNSIRWGGGVASVTLAPDERVYGAVYAVSDADLAALDRYEGEPFVYLRAQAVPRLLDRAGRPRGEHVPAHLYVLARGAGRVASPAPRYLELIERGYDTFGLPRRALRAALRASS